MENTALSSPETKNKQNKQKLMTISKKDQKIDFGPNLYFFQKSADVTFLDSSEASLMPKS